MSRNHRDGENQFFSEEQQTRDVRLRVNSVSTQMREPFDYRALNSTRLQAIVVHVTRTRFAIDLLVRSSLPAPPSRCPVERSLLLRVIKRIEENAARLRRAEFRTRAVRVPRN